MEEEHLRVDLKSKSKIIFYIASAAVEPTAQH